MHYEVLDENRLKLLPLLKEFKDDFYLAGGTALALQIGHRRSIDFDFFSGQNLDTKKLFEKIKKIFINFRLAKIQEEKNTLSVLVNKIKISYFSYGYKLIKRKIEEENIFLASLEDIACMKLSAILGRATNKDYIDLYFILKQIELKSLIESAAGKFPDIDTNLILKSLVYFEDIEAEPIMFMDNQEISFIEVQKFLIKAVKNFGSDKL